MSRWLEAASEPGIDGATRRRLLRLHLAEENRAKVAACRECELREPQPWRGSVVAEVAVIVESGSDLDHAVLRNAFLAAQYPLQQAAQIAVIACRWGRAPKRKHAVACALNRAKQLEFVAPKAALLCGSFVANQFAAFDGRTPAVFNGKVEVRVNCAYVQTWAVREAARDTRKERDMREHVRAAIRCAQDDLAREAARLFPKGEVLL